MSAGALTQSRLAATCTLLATRQVLRCWPSWVIAPLAVVVLGWWPGFAVGPGSVAFQAELLATSITVMVWGIGLTCLDNLRTADGRLFGAVSLRCVPQNVACAEVGVAVGAFLATAIVGAVALLSHLSFRSGDPDWTGSLVATGQGWLAGCSLILWSLILTRWFARPAILVVTLLVLLVNLTPAVIPSGAVGDLVRALFFPVSPSTLTSDDFHRSGAVWRWFAAGLMHDLGLLALLLALAFSRGRARP